MKKLLLLLTALAVCAVMPSKSAAAWRPTFVIVSTWVPTGTGTYGWSFQSQSTAREIRIEKLDIFNCSSVAVSGGMVKFEVLLASAVVDGGLQYSTYTFTGSGDFPASVTASTGPVGIALEHETILNHIPFLTPAFINVDEAATTNLIKTYDFTSEKTQPLIFPKGGTRGIVIRQTQVSGNDYTVGCIGARVTFTAK